ncbi:uncharacterized protein BJ212DRAFT_51933 [Suillus subaureus]|uniref:Uncharacterized protein n=1 Tax=Suillus subaureus TaxID=48587 RepID=A0A9P7EPW5_9AGAM|nr:uncharacterized protein BJ212DRAFT_51933 [Suillus subaureus]KAG1827419.1 hypothetical protein BJ212DRAFT_51933 [Suillus subaureus]
MSEKSLSIEALQGIGSASEISHILSYHRQKTRAAVDLKILDEQVSQKHVTHLGEAPDGGLRAWLVAFAAALVMFSTLGFLLSWGIFQAYYEENLLLHTSPSTIAWIGSTQVCLLFGLANLRSSLVLLVCARVPSIACNGTNV